MLSELDLRLLHLIEMDPTISIRELSTRASTSWITANRHLQMLRESGILSHPTAVFNPSAIGLERYVVLAHATDIAGLELLERACDAHPYTHYRSRIYGPYPGLFAQFDIPPEGSRLLRRYFEILQREQACVGMALLRSEGFRESTRTNQELFDPHTLSWNYDWAHWDEDIDSASDVLPQPATRRSLSELRLTRVDLEILAALTANADISQEELMNRFGLSQSTVSRRLIFLRENVIESVRAQIDRARFDIISTKLFYAQRCSEAARAKVFNAIKAPSAPPFPLSVDLLDGGGLVLWGRMSPRHEHSLFYVLWRRFPEMQVFTMDTIRDHSRMYWFYPDNVDPETNSWKTDEDWMLNQPLSALEPAHHSSERR
ncbi:MAG: winged helix-turn-helix transcriptional regulator [Candidatus Thorarchaeota archaeon]